MPKTINRECDHCGTLYEAVVSYLKRNQGKFCSRSCSAKKNNANRVDELRKTQKQINWNENIAYLTGLITSDGTLFREKKRLGFINADYELISHVKEILKNEITGKEHNERELKKKKSNWWQLNFYSINYYEFCLKVGLMPNKSLILKSIDVPDEYFSHFLRGLIDGDGSYTLKKKKRYLNLEVFSGSKEFLEWLKDKCVNLYDLKGGGVHKRKKNWGMAFGHYDSEKILKAIYKNDTYSLSRKKDRARLYFDI